MNLEFCSSVEESNLSFIMVAVRYFNQWVFCLDQTKNAYSIPAALLEKGADPLKSAEQLLQQKHLQNGIIHPFSYLKVETDHTSSWYGQIFIAEVCSESFLESDFLLLDHLPQDLLFPVLQTAIWKKINQEYAYSLQTERKRMLSGKLYVAKDEELAQMHAKALKLTYLYNHSDPLDFEGRRSIIRDLFGGTKSSFHIEPTIHCDYGSHIFIGENFYANYDCVFLDVNPIVFGDNVFIAPRCCFYTAGHPIDKDIRKEQLEFGSPIRVGNDVWIGGSVVVNPGVTIGDNVVIGSGSVVTKDIPSGVIAAGNPCRILRPITDEDRQYWEMKKQEYLADFLKK